jgi:DNA-binding response OmpR family regulator
MAEMLTLIVDDNQHAADIVRSVLRSLGARRIRYAATEEDAFRAFCGERFDLVILDQNLGTGGEGFSLARRMRLDPRSPNRMVAILMLTAYAQQHHVLAARDAGIDEFLMKPFTAKALAMRIATLVSAPRHFVSSTTYFGPDRRRPATPGYEGPDRRRGRDRTS